MNAYRFETRLPPATPGTDAGDEYFFLTEKGETRKIWLQDYELVYSIPGFYEHVAIELLAYQSPAILSGMLAHGAGGRLEGLGILELGAGSGLMGRRLKALGAASLTGVDILSHAAEAAARDSPGIYDAYHVADLSHEELPAVQELASQSFDCLVCCSALSHIPAAAFARAFSWVLPGGLIALNVMADDWEGGTGFRAQHPWMDDPSYFQQVQEKRYVHRRRCSGGDIEYVGIVGKKVGPAIPKEGL